MANITYTPEVVLTFIVSLYHNDISSTLITADLFTILFVYIVVLGAAEGGPRGPKLFCQRIN